MWKITQLDSRALNFMVFSCSSGSLSAITPCLPKNSHWQKLLNASTLLVAAVTRRRRAPSERNRSSWTVRMTCPTSRNAA